MTMIADRSNQIRDPRDVDSFKTSELLHPEVMDLNTISHILKQRGVDNTFGRGSATMEKALEVYNVLVLPKPQRVYKSNRVGQRLLKNRQKKIASSPGKKSGFDKGPTVKSVPATKRPVTSDPMHNNGSPASKKGRSNINWP